MAATATARPDERGPFGIDRRTVKPALLVLALAVLMSVVLPLIDSRTRYQDEIHEGDVAQIAEGITLVPTPGWNLASGALVGDTRSPVGSTGTTQLVVGVAEDFVGLTRQGSVVAFVFASPGMSTGAQGQSRPSAPDL
jgi:hypothetical protein